MTTMPPALHTRIRSGELAPNGHPIAANFDAWFDDSCAVDGAGAPLRLYHGTSAREFDGFRNPFAGKGWEMFSDSPGYSASFALGEGARIIPVYLSIRNPLDLRALPPERGDARHRLLQLLSRNGIPIGELAVTLPFERDLYQIVNIGGHHTDLAARVQAAGFDGILLPELFGEAAVTTYIAFEAGQIKSAIGNNGNFDRRSAALTDRVEVQHETALARVAAARRLCERPQGGRGIAP